MPSSSHPEGHTNGWSVYVLSELGWEHQRTEPKDSVSFEAGDRDFEAVEPQVAAIYRLSDAWSVFGSVAFVNRIPTVDELYDGSMVTNPNPDLKSEKGKNLEIGTSYAGGSILAEGDQSDEAHAVSQPYRRQDHPRRRRPDGL